MAFLTSLLNSLDLRSVRWDIKFPSEGRLRDFDRRVESFTLSFKEHGESNSFSMVLDNSDRFFGKSGIFESGDEIEFWLYYAARPKILMGTYVVDDLDDNSVPSTVNVEGLAVDCQKKTLRTRKARAFEGISLGQIVGRVASENSLQPVFEGADILLRRKDQREEHDLKFLARLADEYGFRTRIEGSKLYFLSKPAIEAAGDTIRLKDGILGTRRFKYKPYKGVAKATAKYMDPHKNQVVQSDVESGDIKVTREVKMTTKVDSPEEAERIATAKMEHENSRQKTGEFDCLGAPEMKPPVTAIVEDEGDLWDGAWHIESADHNYSKTQGYRVNMKGYKL